MTAAPFVRLTAAAAVTTAGLALGAILAPSSRAGSQVQRTSTVAGKSTARLSLLAVAKDAQGAVLYRHRVRLESLERADIRIVRRTASSVTVEQRGAGPTGPRATFRIRILPAITDALAHVRAKVPTSTSEGVVTGVGPNTPTPVVLSAYRVAAGTSSHGRFSEYAVAAAQLRSRYFEPRDALVELRVKGRTSVGTNTFTSVPGLYATVRSFAG